MSDVNKCKQLFNLYSFLNKSLQKLQMLLLQKFVRFCFKTTIILHLLNLTSRNLRCKYVQKHNIYLKGNIVKSIPKAVGIPSCTLIVRIKEKELSNFMVQAVI